MAQREPFAFPIGGLDDGIIRVRVHADEDLERVAAASRDPEVLRWTRVPEDNSAAAMREWIGEWRGRGDELHLIIVTADGDELIGAIGLLRHEAEERRCEIGYWLAAPARGRGHATRAVRLLGEWAFADLGVERIGIAVEPGNEASMAVPRRCGYRYEGILRSWFEIKGRRRDVAMFSLLRGEPTP